MKALLTRLVLLILLGTLFAVPAMAGVRTIQTLPGVPVTALKSYLPGAVFQRLANEPIKAWIVVRGQIVDNKILGGRVVRSEANGVYDKVSIQMANDMELYAFSTGTNVPPSAVVHILVYQLPKGEHAIAIAQNDSLGDTNLLYARSLMFRYLGLANAKPAPKKAPRR